MAYMMKGPIYQTGGKVENATNVHTDIVSLDIDGTATDATISVIDSNDLVIQNPMSDGDVRVKLGSTDGGGSFLVQNSDNTMLFKLTSTGHHIENYKVLTTSGTTISDIAPTSRFILINLSSATVNVTSNLLNGNNDGQVVTIIVVNHGAILRTFVLTINSYVNPGSGVKASLLHTFSNQGMSISLIWYTDAWFNVHSGTV